MAWTGFWLTDEQYERLAPLLPRDTRGVPRVDDRRVISGIVHLLRSGCRWKDAPVVYGPYKTLYNRFVRWAAKGVWEDVFLRLAEASGPPAALGPKRRLSAGLGAAAPPISTPPSTNSDGRDA